MKIECILKREGGSKVGMGDTVYHFLPDAEGRHVAFVGDDEHMARFLSIREGYRLLREGAAAVPPPEPAPEPAPEPEQEPAPEPEQEPAPPAPIEPPAPAASALPIVEAPAEPAPVADIAGMDKAALVEAYKARFGTAPHPRLGETRLREMLTAG